MNTTTPTLKPSAIDCIEQVAEHALLAAKPSMEEAKKAVGKLADGKAVGTDNPCGEQFKVGLTEYYDIYKYLHNIELRVWHQEVVSLEWKDTIIKVLFEKPKAHKATITALRQGPTRER